MGAALIEVARIPQVLAGAPEVLTDWMSESELARLALIRVAARRAQYLAGHWLARRLLERAFGGTSAQWQLLECRSQPPQVQGHGDALRVSISHSGDWVAAAVADVAIGIDLEQRTRTLDAAIEPLLLNDDEVRGSLNADALLQRWVAKEAWIKRDAGSALAGRLERLQLRPVSRDQADVCVDSNAAFHFGLAIAPGCRVNRQCDLTLMPGVAFAITDAEADQR